MSPCQGREGLIMMDKLIERRLVIEGAIVLYEQKPDCSSDEYSLIGEALYLLRERLKACQETVKGV